MEKSLVWILPVAMWLQKNNIYQGQQGFSWNKILEEIFSIEFYVMHIKWCSAAFSTILWKSPSLSLPLVWLAPLTSSSLAPHHSQPWSSFPAILDISKLLRFSFLILPPDFTSAVLCLASFSMLFWLPSTQISGNSFYLTSSGMLSIKSLLHALNFSNFIPYCNAV